MPCNSGGRGPLLILLAFLLGLPASAATDTFTFGVVPQFDARRTLRVWKPLLTYLETETGNGDEEGSR